MIYSVKQNELVLHDDTPWVAVQRPQECRFHFDGGKNLAVF
jgi:hypothetical protein